MLLELGRYALIASMAVSYTHLDVYKRQVWDYPNKQKSDVKGRVSLTDFSPVGTHRICLLISQNRIPRRFLREMSLHFTTDTKRAFVEYRISKKSKNHWISHVKATVSVTSIDVYKRQGQDVDSSKTGNLASSKAGML